MKVDQFKVGDLAQVSPENLVFWVRNIEGDTLIGDCCTRKGGRTVVSVPADNCILWPLDVEIPPQ